MFGVSLLETTVTEVMSSPSTVTSTVIGPPKPSAVPVSPPPELPALSRAFFTALIMPLLVKVAPATMSTSGELASTMAAGICSSAPEAMLGVSLLEVTTTEVIVSPSIVTSTVIGPPKPSAVPVSTPPPPEAMYLLAVFTALIIADEVMVAPVTASISPAVSSPLLLSRDARKSQSPFASCPRP